MLFINTIYSHHRKSQLSDFLHTSAVSLVQFTVHNHSVAHSFRVVKNLYVHVCVCVYTPPTFPQCGLGLLWASMIYTKTRVDTSSAAHTLMRNERGAPSCLLLYLFSSLPDSDNRKTNNMFTLHLELGKEWEQGWPQSSFQNVFSFYCLGF